MHSGLACVRGSLCQCARSGAPAPAGRQHGLGCGLYAKQCVFVPLSRPSALQGGRVHPRGASVRSSLCQCRCPGLVPAGRQLQLKGNLHVRQQTEAPPFIPDPAPAGLPGNQSGVTWGATAKQSLATSHLLCSPSTCR